MGPKELPVINAAVDKLMTRLFERQEALRRMESRSGKGWKLSAINKVREEVASLKRRLRLAEKLQDEALSTPDVHLTVCCVACKATRVLKASEGPHNNIPTCEKDGMPMVAVKAEAKR